VLQVAPSGYRRYAASKRDPALLSARAKRDAALVLHIERVWQANMQVYGADKLWRQLQGGEVPVARCTVEGPMRRHGLRGELAANARSRQREDLAALFEISADERAEKGRAANQAIEWLRALPPPAISDDIRLWLTPRAVAARRAHGIDTLAALTVRVPRRRWWWASIPGLGLAVAKRIEAFLSRSIRNLPNPAR
jgi:hypothetical protein